MTAAPHAPAPGDAPAKPQKRRLAARLILLIVLFSLAITLASTAIQLVGEYEADVENVALRMRQMEKTALPSITENVWLLDRERLHIQLDGITRLPDFLHAVVVLPDGSPLAESGAPPQSRALVQETPLTYNRRGRDMKIGFFRLTASLDGTLERTLERAGFLLVSNAVNTFLVAVLIYFLVHRLITRHMEHMARYARSFSLDTGGTQLVLARKEVPGRPDELSDLVGAVNEMRTGLYRSYRAVRELNETLEQRVADRTAELTREIAVRMRVETDLRDALDLNEKIADKSPIGILVLDENGDFISSNAAAARIVGATAERMAGINYFSLESWVESGLSDMARRAVEDGQPQHNPDVFILTIFGREVVMDCHFVPFTVGGRRRVMLMFSDVSEARKAERALRASEQKFRDYAEAASQWFWETDENHRFTAIHGGDPDTGNLPLNEVIGRARWEVVGDQGIERDPEGWARNRADMDGHRLFRGFEYAITGKNGQIAYVSIDGKPVFDEDENFKGYRGTGHDITARREIEIQLIQASKMATLGEMATGVAHELNQPLNVIRMAVANIERKADRGVLDPEYLADKLRKVGQNVDRAAAIIDHMRVFGRKEVAAEEVNPCDAVREAFSMIGTNLEMAGVSVDLVLPDAVPAVRANPVQLEQVVLNLLGNARDALEDNGVADKRIVVEVAACGDAARCGGGPCDETLCAGDAVAIFVRDNAGGVPDAIRERIFEPFFTTKQTGKGTGLGLSISYGIVKEMGGALKVDNVDGGAEFMVLLPAKAAAAHGTAASA